MCGLAGMTENWRWALGSARFNRRKSYSSTLEVSAGFSTWLPRKTMNLLSPSYAFLLPNPFLEKHLPSAQVISGDPALLFLCPVPPVLSRSQW